MTHILQYEEDKQTKTLELSSTEELLNYLYLAQLVFKNVKALWLMSGSSSGLGYKIFILVTGIRIPHSILIYRVCGAMVNAKHS